MSVRRIVLRSGVGGGHQGLAGIVLHGLFPGTFIPPVVTRVIRAVFGFNI